MAVTLPQVVSEQLRRWLNAAPETQLKPVTPGAFFWRVPVYDPNYAGYEDVELHQYLFCLPGRDLYVYAGYAPINKQVLYWIEEQK